MKNVYEDILYLNNAFEILVKISLYNVLIITLSDEIRNPTLLKSFISLDTDIDMSTDDIHNIVSYKYRHS